MESDHKGLPKNEDSESIDLTKEIWYMIAELLPDKSLVNLRATSKTNHDLVDRIILRPDNLTKLFNRFSLNQVINFIQVYLKLYQDEFANKVKDLLSLYLGQLKPNDAIDILTQLHGRNAIIDNMIMNYISDEVRVLNIILNCDQDHLYTFGNQFPNLFQKEMGPNAPLFKRLTYILTVSDIHSLTQPFMDGTTRLLHNYRMSDPKISTMLANLASSMGFQALIAHYLSPRYDPAKERGNAMWPFHEDSYQAYANLRGLNLSDNIWDGAAKLSRPNFSEVNLSRSRFVGVDLTNVVFIRANLKDSNLSGANLTNTNFRYANLTNVKLIKTLLKNTNFSHANLTNCEFYQHDLSTLNFANANLTSVKFLEPDCLKKGALLTKKLTQLYDMIHSHPQFNEIVLAMAEQIYNHAQKLKKDHPKLTKELLDATLNHGIFRRPSTVKSTLQSDIYFQKPILSAEMKQIQDLYEELANPATSRRPR